MGSSCICRRLSGFYLHQRRVATSSFGAHSAWPYSTIEIPYRGERQRQTWRVPCAYPPVWCRGAKTQSTVQLQDLPQGVVPAPLQPLKPLGDDDHPVYPTVIQQARDNMRKFNNCVLLTRVGSFYEVRV